MPLNLATYTNGRVTFCKDAIFGWCVLLEGPGWQPLSMLDKDGLEHVWKEMDHSPIFPKELIDDLQQRLAA